MTNTCNIIIKNPNFNPSKSFYRGFRKPFFRVSCGKCPQCLAFKTQFRSELVSYEFNKVKNGIGTFLTLTYDDDHIEPLLSTDCYGKPILSLRRVDYVNFVKRMRRYLQYHNLYDDKVCFKDFKIVGCGEYGDKFKRPHFHLLLLGISPRVAEIVCRECWHNGFIKALPIKPGSIRYVMKYTEKQTNTKENMIMYDSNNIERPFFKWSQGIAKDLYLSDRFDFDTLQFKGSKNRLIDIPYYYKQKFYKKNVVSNHSVRNARINARYGRDPLIIPSFDEIVEDAIERSNKSNEFLVAQYRQQGVSVYEENIPENTSFYREELGEDIEKNYKKIVIRS